jgi:hypothetical protein
VPGRRFDEPDAAREEERAPAQPSAREHPSAHALLALQRSAGNAAVSGMIQRKFYERTDSGSYVWHGENADAQWEPTGETTWWLMPFWRYPVYKKAGGPPPLVADEVLDTGEAVEEEEEEQAAETAAAPTKRRRRKKKKSAAAAAPEEELIPTTAEPPTVTTAPEEEEQEEEDDDGFTQVKSKSASRKEAAANVDVDALARAIDAHTGAPTRILETFNRMFNGLDAQGLLRTGAFSDAYVSRYDRGRGFSVEVTIPRLNNWVLHAHLHRDGTLQEGDNAVHYKRASQRGDLGVSIALLQKQIDALLPDAAACLLEAGNRNLRI